MISTETLYYYSTRQESVVGKPNLLSQSHEHRPNPINFLPTCWFVQVEFPGMNASGGPMYIGTGCFHRRDALTGMKYSKESKIQWKERRNSDDQVIKGPTAHLLDRSKVLASCTYEQNTQWGKEVPQT